MIERILPFSVLISRNQTARLDPAMMEPTTPRKQQTITYQLLAANEQRTMTTLGNNNKNNPHATINYSLSPNPVHETVPVNDNKKQQRHAATAATTCDKTASVDNDSDNNNMRLQQRQRQQQHAATTTRTTYSTINSSFLPNGKTIGDDGMATAPFGCFR